MPEPTLVIAIAAVGGLVVVAAALLRGWQQWLAFKQRELETRHAGDTPSAPTALGAARIELSDLKERIRKLEAIASGVDL